MVLALRDIYYLHSSRYLIGDVATSNYVKQIAFRGHFPTLGIIVDMSVALVEVLISSHKVIWPDSIYGYTAMQWLTDLQYIPKMYTCFV